MANICFNWDIDNNFIFIKDLFPPIIEDNTERVEHHINICINNELEIRRINDIVKSVPSIKTGFDGMYCGLFVSSYLNKSIIIITDIANNVTFAKIDPGYNHNTRILFLSTLLRKHVFFHYVSKGYLVYHASAILDRNTKKSIILLGSSGSGKTTFVMEAVKSGNYYFISDDRIVMNPNNKQIFGSPVVHLRSNAGNEYNYIIENKMLINGGIKEKKHQALIKECFYTNRAVCNCCIFLKQYDNNTSSFLEKINNDECDDMFYNSQENLYSLFEKEKYQAAIKAIKSFEIFKLSHVERDKNFEVFLRGKNQWGL
ncbi:MAG: hypothetical protein LBE13_00150 [Bacteroidales bacterium]|jgi:hypothetical protein|nr:hypothetical protein [Bacteroidales bacterium]